MRTVAIIQARTGSTRLPGKVMMDLDGQTVIHRVIHRVRRMKTIDAVVCAVPRGEHEAQLGRAARAAGAEVFVGPEHDVLDRYAYAAEAFKADVIVRITADCPLIDPAVCDQVVKLRTKEMSPYASNVHPRSWPKGLDCEVFMRHALKLAHDHAVNASDREHVTPYIIREFRRVNLPSKRFDLANKRWTLDYPEDLEFLRAIYVHGEPMGYENVLKILAEHPELEAINAELAA